MKKFNFQNTIQDLIVNQRIVEVRFAGSSKGFKVGIISSADKLYLYLIEIDTKGQFDGVCMYRMEDISSIKIDTLYCSKVLKLVNVASLYEAAMQYIREFKEHSFDSFLSYLENTGQVSELIFEDAEILVGRIAGLDDEIVVVDEFIKKSPKSFSRAYANIKNIRRISVGIPYLINTSKLY